MCNKREAERLDHDKKNRRNAKRDRRRLTGKSGKISMGARWAEE